MPSPRIGPQREQAAEVQVDPVAFAAVIGDLCEGSSRFPVPFDLRSSVALADNEVDGDVAEALFTASRGHVRRKFHIQVHEVIDEPDGPRREVVDSVATKSTAIALLLDLISDLDERE